MKSRAAVAFGSPVSPLEIVEIDVEPPRKGEVLVKITHTGVCHTDAFTLSGDDPEGVFPAVLGHEGAGVVVEVGEGVTSVETSAIMLFRFTRQNAASVCSVNPEKLTCVISCSRHPVVKDLCLMARPVSLTRASLFSTIWAALHSVSIPSSQKCL